MSLCMPPSAPPAAAAMALAPSRFSRSVSEIVYSCASTITKANISSVHSVKAPDIASVQRKVVVRANSGRGTEDEAFATDAMDHRRLVGSVHLPPQAAHMDVDQVALRHELVVPDFLEQHGAGQQLTLAAHHVFEKPELAREEVDRPVVAFRGSRQEVELERTGSQRRVLAF